MEFLSQSKKIQALVLLLTSFIAILIIYQIASIRWNGYESIPTIGIFDERNYVLQGISLRKYGIPIGWSDSGAYEHGNSNNIKSVNIEDLTIVVNGQKPNFSNITQIPKPVIAVGQFDFGLGMQHLKLVMPFIDHSPLGGLIMSIGVSDKVRGFLDLTPNEFRRTSLSLAIASSILLFLYTLQLTKNPLISLMALAIYSTVPTYLITSRFALLENVLIPLTLLHLNLLLFSQYLLQRQNKFSLPILVVAGITAGMSVLAKESAIGIIIASLILTIIWRFPRIHILSFLAASSIAPLIYITWGFWLAPKLFWEILQFNAERRFFGSLNFLTSLPGLRFHNFPYDGWWIWGFISIFVMSLEKIKPYLPFFLPFATYLATLMLMSNLNYPWYYLSLVPFLAVATSWSFWKLLVSPNIPFATAFFLIPLSSSFYWGYTVFHLPPQISLYRLIFAIYFTILTLRIIKNRSHLLTTIWMIFFILLSVQLIKWNIQSLYFILSHWENLPMPSLPTF